MSREKLDRAISNCIVEIPLISMKARFLTLIDRIGQRGTVLRVHFEILID
jgi:hypothetical protein